MVVNVRSCRLNVRSDKESRDTDPIIIIITLTLNNRLRRRPTIKMTLTQGIL